MLAPEHTQEFALDAALAHGHPKEFALVFPLAQGVLPPCCGATSYQNLVGKICRVVKKQRQKVQCGEKTTANFALRVYPIRVCPYVVFLHKA
jgi:hypothetical protein